MISGLGLAAWLNATFLALVLTYAILNALYNIRLKHIAITDVTVIALGFVIRIFCGGVLTTTPISHWLVLMTFLLALLLALGKRRYDLREEMKYALTGAASGYTQAYIDTTITLLGSVTAVAYIFYTISPDVTGRIGSDLVYLTCLPVMLGLMRYLQVLIVFEKPADPVDLFVHDHFLKVIVLTWLIIFVILIYH
jgi:4-hydroxybenzoate polyprenyltransferase